MGEILHVVSKICNLSGRSDAWDTTVRSRICASVLSIGWEFLGGELLAAAASLGPSVEIMSERKGVLGIFISLLSQSMLVEGEVHRLGREDRRGKGSYAGDFHCNKASSSKGDSLGKILKKEEGSLDITSVDEATGVTRWCSE